QAACDATDPGAGGRPSRRLLRRRRLRRARRRRVQRAHPYRRAEGGRGADGRRQRDRVGLRGGGGGRRVPLEGALPPGGDVSAPAFHLLETMRWGGPVEGVALIDRHLARLAGSADYFGFGYEPTAVRAALGKAAARLPETPHRLRLRLAADGSAEVEAAPLDAEGRIERVVLHPEPVVPGGPFWRHKTTHRPHYEGPCARARAAGFDEAILLDAA